MKKLWKNSHKLALWDVGLTGRKSCCLLRRQMSYTQKTTDVSLVLIRIQLKFTPPQRLKPLTTAVSFSLPSLPTQVSPHSTPPQSALTPHSLVPSKHTQIIPNNIKPYLSGWVSSQHVVDPITGQTLINWRERGYMERWLSLLLLQRTQVQFPAPRTPVSGTGCLWRPGTCTHVHILLYICTTESLEKTEGQQKWRLTTKYSHYWMFVHIILSLGIINTSRISHKWLYHLRVSPLLRI